LSKIAENCDHNIDPWPLFPQYRAIETLSIEQCHPIVKPDDADLLKDGALNLEPYFADPNDPNSARITPYQVL
jgi:hypothetical protein